MKDPVGRGSRERMLEAAIALMRESGLSGAGINEVVRLSGAPKGSVYHFFPQGKQQLVAEALALYSGRVQAFIEEALTRGQQPADKLEALADRHGVTRWITSTCAPLAAASSAAALPARCAWTSMGGSRTCGGCWLARSRNGSC